LAFFQTLSHPSPGYLVLLIHLGGLTFLIHSSLSIFSSIPDYLPLLLIHPRLNIFSSIFGGAQLFSSILAETIFSSWRSSFSHPS
jgi:hypothetical protein